MSPLHPTVSAIDGVAYVPRAHDRRRRNQAASRLSPTEHRNQIVVSADLTRHPRLLILLAALLVSAYASSASAGLNQWTSSGPEGGSVISIVTDPTDPRVVYAGTRGGGLFRSTSASEPRWERVRPDLPDMVITALAIDPAAPTNLYAGTESGRVFRSVSRGDHFAEVAIPAGGEVRTFAFDAQRTRVFIGTRSGVIMSPDGGASWRRLPEMTLEILSMTVSTSGALFVVVRTAGRQELHSSIDGGVTWKPIMQYASAVAADSSSSRVCAAQVTAVVVSSDDMKTWVALPLVPTDRPMVNLRCDGTTVYVQTWNSVFMLENGSSRWISLGAPPDFLQALEISSDSPRRVYVGSVTGIFFQSTDAADTSWKRVNDGMNVAFTTDVAIVGKEAAVAATPGGLFKSADGAEAWRKSAPFDERVGDVASDARATVYASGAKGLRRSSDAGESWESVAPAEPLRVAVSRSSPETLYGQLSQSLSRSTDGGRSWKIVETGIDRDFYYGVSAHLVEADDGNSAAAYVANHAGLFKTVTAGESWQPLPLLREEFRDIVVAVAARGSVIHAALDSFAAPGRLDLRGLTTSVDGGATWSSNRLSEERVQAIAMDPTMVSRVYAGTASGRVYRSDDSGDNWSLFSEGMRGAPVNRLELSESGQRLYAATSGGVYVYDYGSALTFQRLPDDPARLPGLIAQLPTGARGAAAGLVLPAVGTVQGSGGATFRTDVTLANRRAAEQVVIVAWLPQGNASGASVPTFRLTLPAATEEGGGTLTVADVGTLLGLQGLGSMLVIATGATGQVDQVGEIDGFARVRSSALCGSGAVSQSFAAVGSESFSGPGGARALGLRHEPGYRTNVGIVNLSAAPRVFTVAVSGERRNDRFTITVPPYAPAQTAVPAGDYGAVTLTVISDGGGASPWVAYGSSVDNASGDAWASVARPRRQP